MLMVSRTWYKVSYMNLENGLTRFQSIVAQWLEHPTGVESYISHRTPTQPEFNPGFCRMKQLEVLLLLPGWDASSPQGYSQHFVADTHLYTWVEWDNNL